MTSNNSRKICEYCNKSFSTPQNLRIHKQSAKYCINSRKSKQEKATEDICKYCGYVFSQKSSLLRHTASCMSHKEFIIKECEKRIVDLQEDNDAFQEIILTQEYEIETHKDEIKVLKKRK